MAPLLFQSHESAGISRAVHPGRNERTGCPPYARREYEAVPLETIAGEEGDERKARKEGRRLACANRGASFRAAHVARRVCTSPRSITFAYHLSAAPFYLLLPSCLHLFPMLLCSLSPLTALSTADNEPLLAGDYSSSPLAKQGRRVLLHGGLRASSKKKKNHVSICRATTEFHLAMIKF